MVTTLLNDFGRDREVNRVDGDNVDNILLRQLYRTSRIGRLRCAPPMHWQLLLAR